MASITKNQLISDIQLQLNQGILSDDSELERGQIAAWIDYELNQLIRQECDAAVKAAKQIPPIYITRERNKRLTEESNILTVNNLVDLPSGTEIGYVKSTNKYYRWSGNGFYEISRNEALQSDLDQRVYFSLTGLPVDLLNDAGIIRVLNDEYELINKSTIETLDMVKHLRFSGPSKDTPIWYRVGSNIYLEGISDSEIYDNTFIVDYVKKQNIMSLADTDAITVSDLVLPVLVDKVVQRGKLQMYGTTPDLANDGVDTKQSVYHTAIQNPSRNEQTAQQ